MRFRKLRIAWSVFWGSAAVLLIVFWVRSYGYGRTAAIASSHGFFIKVRRSSGIETSRSYRRCWRNRLEPSVITSNCPDLAAKTRTSGNS
jgi:hypothetical protein